MSENGGIQEIMQRLTLNVVTTLEKRNGICDVILSNHPPTERHKLVAWEQRNSCMLPDDLKSFYLTTNGILLTWSVKLDDVKHQIGKMEICPISDLQKISVPSSTTCSCNNISLADIDSDSDSEDETKKPHFDDRSRIFELDSCNGFGKVCLIYFKTSKVPAQNTEIWFLDRSLSWSFLAKDFTTYYRLMIMHVGLPCWQYAFTSIGLNPKSKQWFSMYTPVRLQLDENLLEESEIENSIEIMVPKIDFSRVFKGKLPEKPKGKNANQMKKKVNPAGSVPGSKSLTSLRYGRTTKPWT